MLRKGHGGLYKATKWKKEKNDRVRGEGDQIKFIDLELKDGKL